MVIARIIAIAFSIHFAAFSPKINPNVCSLLHLFFFSHDGKETKDLALAARRPFTALGAKTAKLASLEQTPFLRSLRPKGPRLRSLWHSDLPLFPVKLKKWFHRADVILVVVDAC